jgi:hypothetical protein
MRVWTATAKAATAAGCRTNQVEMRTTTENSAMVAMP